MTQPSVMPVFIILYVPVLQLITQDLVKKLCNCKSTYLGRVDGVRDEVINHWLWNFGSRLRLIVGSIRYVVRRQTNNYVGYHNYLNSVL